MDRPVLRHPFRAFLCGPSASGKSVWTKRFLDNIGLMMSVVPDKIFYLYQRWQPLYDRLQGVTFIKGLPDDFEAFLQPGDCNKLIILDDMMEELSGKRGNAALNALFTRDSHHLNASILMISQNCFFKNQRTSRINCTYLILTKSVSDKLQIMTLAKQLYPGASQFFIKAYESATERPYSYLFVDLHLETRDKMRLTTNIFPDEWPVIVYCPSGGKVYK